MYKHILIATDGSELAAKAVAQGLDLAKALGAKVTAVTVTEPWTSRGLRDDPDAHAHQGLRQGMPPRMPPAHSPPSATSQRRSRSPATPCT